MSPTDGLQFQTAEFSGRKCAVCQTTIGDAFYQIQGRDACPPCAQARLTAQSLPDGGGKLMKGILWGIGGMLLGAAGLAIVAFMGMRLALLTIGVGWLIGTAIKKGTEGHTSRKYQVLAVLLTYLAMGVSYIPLVMAGIGKKEQKKVARSANRNSVTVSPEGEVSTPRNALPPPSPLLMLITVAVMSVAFPLIDSFSRMPMGLLTLFIYYLGLQQAWKQTAPDAAVIVGPYPNTPST